MLGFKCEYQVGITFRESGNVRSIRVFFDLPKLWWVGKQINNMKPTKLPNPIKIRLKMAFGPLFPTATNFSWVGIDFE